MHSLLPPRGACAGLKIPSGLPSLRHCAVAGGAGALLAALAMLAGGELQAQVLPLCLVGGAAVAVVQSLERRVAQRTKALTAANQALQAEIEDRRRLEAELRQAQKLEAIGHLAGGVAHDFNNILMVIQGYTDMLLAEAPDTGTTRSDLREILEAARRGSDLTRQLLAFGRKQVLTIRPLDLNAVLADTSQMLARLLGESVRLELRAAPVACPIEADRVQLEQVLINLAVNARDAMSGRGTLHPADRARYRLRHGRGHARPHLRTVLHDQSRG